MYDLSKRIFTSVPLVIFVYFSLKNNTTLFFLLTITGYVVLTEIFYLISKIFKKDKNKTIILFLISIIYLSLCFKQLYFFITNVSFNKIYFIFFLSVCVATDIGGYTFGRLFKGKKLIKISPKKTYSGLIGSYVFSIIVFIYFYNQFNFSIKFLILTVLTSTISQMGDLFISYVKRRAKVKDTGDILPGHGGVLDRIDGLIFALPISINLLFLFK